MLTIADGGTCTVSLALSGPVAWTPHRMSFGWKLDACAWHCRAFGARDRSQTGCARAAIGASRKTMAATHPSAEVEIA